MKKIVLLILIIIISQKAHGQVYLPKKAEKIMFLDTEYILEKIPRYKIAQAELDKFSQEWQNEIDQKYNEIMKLEADFKNEKIFLIDELVEERVKQIDEKKLEIKELENKYFGPSGQYITKKYLLVKPVQDLIFTAVYELANEKGYDYVFDKSGDLLMIYYNPSLDISELVIKKIKDL